MEAVFVACGLISLIGLVAELPNGGWRRVLPLLVLLAIVLFGASALSTTGQRLAFVVVGFALVFALRRWLYARYPKTPNGPSSQ